jgi:hypothetical protein
MLDDALETVLARYQTPIHSPVTGEVPFRPGADAALQEATARLAALHHDNTILTREVTRLRQMLRQFLARLLAPSVASPLTAMADDTALRDLIVFAHPDKWQGQAAETLAHEITVRLNKLRETRQ